MARGPRYIVKYRRRREGKTDYKKRIRMLSSGKKRLVIRKSVDNITVQIVEHGVKGDKVMITIASNILEKKGWKGKKNNIPAAYLTGLMIGKKAKEKGIKEAIVDLGLAQATKGSKLYALVKGAKDAGLQISCAEDVIPSQERISGKHIVQYAEKLKKKGKERYQKIFSAYLKRGIEPENLEKHFNEIRERLME